MIKSALKTLGISSQNLGSSTGQQWFSEGKEFESFSPVDGKLIANIKSSNRKDYEAVIKQAGDAFLHWRLLPAPKEETSFVSWETSYVSLNLLSEN